jgi:hypothetical protein
MKHYKAIEVPAQTLQSLTHVSCDMCNATIPNKPFEVDDVEVSYESGNAYPDGRFTTTQFVDLCSKCFTDKLLPWLEAQGCVIQTKESDG